MNPWKREGLNYVVRLCTYGKDRLVVTRKLFFISYWGIYWIHGDEKLTEMAWRRPK